MSFLRVSGLAVFAFGLTACVGGGADGNPQMTDVEEPEQVSGETVGRAAFSRSISSDNVPGSTVQLQIESFSANTLEFFVGTTRFRDQLLVPSGVDAINDVAGYQAYWTQRTPVDGSIAVRGTTPSGAGSGLAFTINDVVYGGNGAAYGYGLRRFGDAFVPDTGTVDYAGNYAGVYRFVSNDRAAGHLTGQAELTINFDDGVSSGMIFDRRNTGTEVLENVTLETGRMLDGGRFLGATSGGSFSGSGASAMRGSYDSLVVGYAGQEVVGAITLTHQLSGTDRFNEVGVFTVVAE